MQTRRARGTAGPHQTAECTNAFAAAPSSYDSPLTSSLRSYAIEEVPSNTLSNTVTVSATLAPPAMEPPPPTNRVFLSIASPRGMVVPEEDGRQHIAMRSPREGRAGDTSTWASGYDFSSLAATPIPFAGKGRSDVLGTYPYGRAAVRGEALVVEGGESDSNDSTTDYVVAALKSQYASPKILASFDFGRKAKAKAEEQKEKDEDTFQTQRRESIVVADAPSRSTPTTTPKRQLVRVPSSSQTAAGHPPHHLTHQEGYVGGYNAEVEAGHRLYTLHRASQARREARAFQKEREAEMALEREATFKPKINETSRRLVQRRNTAQHHVDPSLVIEEVHHSGALPLTTTAGNGGAADVFERLGVLEPKERREKHLRDTMDRKDADTVWRECQQASVEGMPAGNASPPPRRAFSPHINERSQRMPHRGPAYEAQVAWQQRIANKMREKREAAAKEERTVRSPTINARSAALANSQRRQFSAAGHDGEGEEGKDSVRVPVEQRLLAAGRQQAERLDALIAEVSAEERGEAQRRRRALEKGEEHHDDERGTSDPFSRLYEDAEERRRREYEEARALAFESMLLATVSEGGGGAQKLFHPQINPRSFALCPRGPTMREVAGEGDEGGSDDAARTQSATRRRRAHHEVTGERTAKEEECTVVPLSINPTSARIAALKMEREGLAHLPVYDRLAVAGGGGTLRASSNIPTYSFTPQLNSRSVALDKQRNPAAYANTHRCGSGISHTAQLHGGLGGPNRVELLHRAGEAQAARLEAARAARAAAEEERLAQLEAQSFARQHRERTQKDPSSSANGRGGASNYAGLRGSFGERMHAWESRKASKVEQFRHQLHEEAAFECTFTPTLTKTPVFLRSDKERSY